MCVTFASLSSRSQTVSALPCSPLRLLTDGLATSCGDCDGKRFLLPVVEDAFGVTGVSGAISLGRSAETWILWEDGARGPAVLLRGVALEERSRAESGALRFRVLWSGGGRSSGESGQSTASGTLLSHDKTEHGVSGVVRSIPILRESKSN